MPLIRVIVALNAARDVLADGDLSLKDACLVVERSLDDYRLAAALVGNRAFKAHDIKVVYAIKFCVVGLVGAGEKVVLAKEFVFVLEVVVAEVEVIFVPPVKPICPAVVPVEVFVVIPLRVNNQVALDAAALARLRVFVAGAQCKACRVAGLC